METSPGELFERTFPASTTDRLVRCLRRAYATACEHHVPERGSNEVTFGINLYFHAVHEICEEATREPDLLDVTSRQPIFRLQAGAFELACHRVGLSERESIWTSFRADEARVPRESRPALLPEVVVEAPVVTRKRPPPPEVVAEQLVLTRKPKKSAHEAAG